jgi:riboflavin-specific deaminase-like protein
MDVKGVKVTLTYAQSVDGRIATLTGESRWISGSETVRLAHELRACHDGILVGSGTALRDDPELTCRIPGKASPVRIVLDSRLSIPLESTLVKTASLHKTLFIARADAPREKAERLADLGAEVSIVGGDSRGRVDLLEAMGELANRGIRTLLVEGGSSVITSFLRAGFVHRLVVVVAPLVIGEGVPAVGNLGTSRLSEALRLEPVNLTSRGRDIVWELKPHG